jgi:hypothetical protein
LFVNKPLNDSTGIANTCSKVSSAILIIKHCYNKSKVELNNQIICEITGYFRCGGSFRLGHFVKLEQAQTGR